MHCSLAPIAGNGSSHLTTTLKESDYEGLVPAASPFDLPLADLLVHIAGQPANESFIYFDGLAFPAELDQRVLLQSQAQPMEHEPSGLLCEIEIAPDLVRANLVFAVD